MTRVRFAKREKDSLLFTFIICNFTILDDLFGFVQLHGLVTRRILHRETEACTLGLAVRPRHQTLGNRGLRPNHGGQAPCAATNWEQIPSYALTYSCFLKTPLANGASVTDTHCSRTMQRRYKPVWANKSNPQQQKKKLACCEHSLYISCSTSVRTKVNSINGTNA